MAYSYTNEIGASQVTPSASLASGSITVNSGAFLIGLVAASNTVLPTLTESGAGAGNTWQSFGSITDGSANGFYGYYAMNAKAGALTLTGNATDNSVKGVLLAQYAGLATSSALIGWTGSYTSNPGVSGANNVATTNFNVSLQPAMLYGACWDCSVAGHQQPSGGTSPIAFTARSAQWVTMNGGTNYALTTEDTRITATGNDAVTFGTVTGNKGDNFLTLAVAFAEPGASGGGGGGSGHFLGLIGAGA